MAYRFTDTEKWKDSWYSGLKPMEKLLFNFICDNCDIAGFIEVNPRVWSSMMGTTKDVIERSLKGLARGLTYSYNGDCVYLNNFLKHQKNLPLNINNKAHIGIINRINANYSKFAPSVNDFILNIIEIEPKGDQSPTGNGNGNGNGIIGKGGVGEKDFIDFEKFGEYFNTKLAPPMPKIQLPISDQRKAMVNLMVYKHGKEKVIEMLITASKSKFLLGDNQRGWIAYFDWLFKPTNFLNILEGTYLNTEKSKRPSTNDQAYLDRFKKSEEFQEQFDYMNQHKTECPKQLSVFRPTTSQK